MPTSLSVSESHVDVKALMYNIALSFTGVIGNLSTNLSYTFTVFSYKHFLAL